MIFISSKTNYRGADLTHIVMTHIVITQLHANCITGQKGRVYKD